MFFQLDSENRYFFVLNLKFLHSEQNKRQHKEATYRNFRIVCTQSEDCTLEKTVAYAIDLKVFFLVFVPKPTSQKKKDDKCAYFLILSTQREDCKL